VDALRGLTLLLVLQTAGELLARAIGLPLPGPVIGLALLWPCLGVAAVRRWVEPVAGFLLAHLSLLFVPVGVGVVVHLDVLAGQGVRLAVVIVLSTWIGLAVTAGVMHTMLRRAPPPQRPPAGGDPS
jgi:holin-like protein